MTTYIIPTRPSPTPMAGRPSLEREGGFLLINATDFLLINATDKLIISLPSTGTQYTGRIIPT